MWVTTGRSFRPPARRDGPDADLHGLNAADVGLRLTRRPMGRVWRGPQDQESGPDRRSPHDIAGPAGLGAAWAPDGTIIFGSSDLSTGLQRVSDSGGAVTVLTRPSAARGESNSVWPEMLPGGQAGILSPSPPSQADSTRRKWPSSTSRLKSPPTILVPGGSHAHYVSSGHLVYVAGGTLRAVPFDLDRG